MLSQLLVLITMESIVIVGELRSAMSFQNLLALGQRKKMWSMSSKVEVQFLQLGSRLILIWWRVCSWSLKCWNSQRNVLIFGGILRFRIHEKLVWVVVSVGN